MKKILRFIYSLVMIPFVWPVYLTVASLFWLDDEGDNYWIDVKRDWPLVDWLLFR